VALPASLEELWADPAVEELVTTLRR
jgi:hypothetical protein